MSFFRKLEYSKINEVKGSKYGWIQGRSYPDAIQRLRSLGAKPFTLKQNIEALVEDFNTLSDAYGTTRSIEERLQLFHLLLNSSTGLAHVSQGDRFKIVQYYEPFANILPDFHKNYWHLPDSEYSELKEWEIHKHRPHLCGEYESGLSKSEALAHPGWREALGNDIPLLTEYTNIVFNEVMKDPIYGYGMKFYIKDEESHSFAAIFDDISGCVTPVELSYYKGSIHPNTHLKWPATFLIMIT